MLTGKTCSLVKNLVTLIAESIFFMFKGLFPRFLELDGVFDVCLCCRFQCGTFFIVLKVHFQGSIHAFYDALGHWCDEYRAVQHRMDDSVDHRSCLESDWSSASLQRHCNTRVR